MPVTAEGRPVRNASGTGAQLHIAVVFTNRRGTAAALRIAGALARQLNGRVTVFAPIEVSWHLPIQKPPVSPEWNHRRFEALASECPVETTIRLFLCRDAWEILRRVLSPRSLVVLGGRKHWWNREVRLARRLRTLGHEVVLAAMEQNND
jgi:hypothetical protein